MNTTTTTRPKVSLCLVNIGNDTLPVDSVSHKNAGKDPKPYPAALFPMVTALQHYQLRRPGQHIIEQVNELLNSTCFE